MAADIAYRLSKPERGERSLRSSTDFTTLDDEDVRRLGSRWTSTPGLGPVTWSYFCMLLGRPDVKADVMVMRYLRRVLDMPLLDSERGRAVVLATARRLGTDPIMLDHAIWSFERRQRR